MPLFVNVGDRIKVDTRERRYISRLMPQLVDTTIRLLSPQEPLADELSAAGLYELAGELDKAGFACLEVIGRRLLR